MSSLHERARHDARLRERSSWVTVNRIGVTANARLENIRRANIARTLPQDAQLANALDQRVASDMADAQITFQDRAGRNWDAEAYARMVLRTRVATTLNIRYVNKAIMFGSQYVGGVRQRAGYA